MQEIKALGEGGRGQSYLENPGAQSELLLSLTCPRPQSSLQLLTCEQDRPCLEFKSLIGKPEGSPLLEPSFVIFSMRTEKTATHCPGEVGVGQETTDQSVCAGFRGTHL